MKHLKVSFLVIVALMATSFTIATHAGAFKPASHKSVQPFVCQTDLGRKIYWSVYIQCTTGIQYQQAVSPCPPVGHGNFDCAMLVTPNPQGVPCNGGAHFCCAYVNTDGKICPQPCTRVQVFCMP